MAIGRKSVVIIAAQIFSAILGAVALAFIGRNVAPQHMGQVAYALGLAGLAGSFAQAGLNQAHIRKAHSEHLLEACHGALFWLKTRISLVVFTSAAMLFATYSLWKGFEDTTLTLIFLALLYHATLVFRSTFVAAFDAFQHTARAQMVPLMDGLLRAPLVVIAATLLGLGVLQNAPMWIALTYVLGALFGLIFAMLWFKRAGSTIGASTPSLRREYLAFGIPLALGGIVGQWTLQMDTVMIGFFGNAGDVGTYFAANRIIRMVLVFPVAFGTLILPSLAKWGDEDWAKETGRIVRQLSLFLLPAIVLLAMYPGQVLRIAVGGRYTGAAPALQWLALFAIVAVLRVVPLTLAKVRDQPRIALHAGIINLGSNVVLNTLLIPKSVLGVTTAGLGIEGAAIATLVSQSIALTYISWTQRQHMRWEIFGVVAIVGATSFAWLQIPFSWFQDPNRIWELAGVGVLFVAVNWGLMRVFGVLRSEEVHFAADAIHPRKLWHYVRDEMKFRPPS